MQRKDFASLFLKYGTQFVFFFIKPIFKLPKRNTLPDLPSNNRSATGHESAERTPRRPVCKRAEEAQEEDEEGERSQGAGTEEQKGSGEQFLKKAISSDK